MKSLLLRNVGIAIQKPLCISDFTSSDSKTGQKFQNFLLGYISRFSPLFPTDIYSLNSVIFFFSQTRNKCTATCVAERSCDLIILLFFENFWLIMRELKY